MRIAFHFVAVAIVFSVVFACCSRAHSQVVDPSTSVAGVSQAEWSVRWWERLLTSPYDRNPATDDFSHLGDQGPVFFLGSSGGAPTSFDVTINSDDYVFLTLLGVWTFADNPFVETEASLRADSANAIANIDSLYLEIDGVDAPIDPFDLRQQSPPGLYDLDMPNDNLYWLPADVYVSVFEGYWVELASIRPTTWPPTTPA